VEFRLAAPGEPYGEARIALRALAQGRRERADAQVAPATVLFLSDWN
jgi:hypothetical protein